jgi:NADH-quinone oxidoreductase subunit H
MSALTLISDNIFDIFIILMWSMLVFVPILVGVILAVYGDRKIWAAVQKRKGPNVVGPFGLFQVPADGLKYIFKEIIIPDGADKILFIFAPILTFSLGVYGILIAGWSSNSKYPFFGALRSAAQMVSYEVSIGFVIVTVLMCVGSLNLTDIVLAQKKIWFVVPLFPMFIVFFISALAETNRPPFDLPEAESELVAGYQTEYSAIPFVLFFFGEYANILLMCSLTTILFLGGWLPPLDITPFNMIPGFIWFLLKLIFVFYMFAMVKAFVPRYRYDQLMRLGWKVFLPVSLAAVVLTSSILFFFNLAPDLI